MRLQVVTLQPPPPIYNYKKSYIYNKQLHLKQVVSKLMIN